MAKRRATSRRRKQVDHIPKCSHQPRSSPPKRRTDFSLFSFCNWDSLSDSGSLLELSCVKIARLNETLNKSRDGSAGEKETSAQSSGSLNEGSEFSSNALEDSIKGMKLATKIALPVAIGHGNSQAGELAGEALEVGFTLKKSDVVESESEMEFTPKKSHVAESESETPCISPPSVEHERHWSPEDISHISSNGLVKSVSASNSSDERYLSSDKSSPSISSRIEEGSSETGRGKRKCKPKLHFDDDVMIPETPNSEARRVRIMRLLGLTRPIGSPF